MALSDKEVDILKHLQTQQRAELNYRRGREFQIFTWSTTILLAIIGSLFLKGKDSPIVIPTSSFIWRIIISIVIFGLTTYSILWQYHQRKASAAHSRVLAKIAGHLQCFNDSAFGDTDSLYPKSWRGWGTKFVSIKEQLTRPSKISATFLLGILALITLWLQ